MGGCRSGNRWQPYWRSWLAACSLRPTFDPRYVKPGSWPAKYPVQAIKSNGAHTTYRGPSIHAFNVLYFENLAMSGTNARARTYMRLMAHFPLLAHPHPRTALLIGFGVGNTASAIAAHDTIERVGRGGIEREGHRDGTAVRGNERPGSTSIRGFVSSMTTAATS